MARHIYVIDTCVLLHDPAALYKFAEHDVYIPLAVVDDLDDIKTRPGNVSWSAREVFRILDKFDLKEMVGKGIAVNEEKGRVFIYNTEAPLSKNESPNIIKVNSDNAIINAAISLKNANPTRKVTIVTKDTGLRVRANAWGCNAENYKFDLLEGADYKGMREILISDKSDWQILWDKIDINIASFSQEAQSQMTDLAPNEFCIFVWGESRCLTMHNREGKFVILKDKSNEGGKLNYMGVEPVNMEQRCALAALADDTIPLVTLMGSAGTGKTILALAVALDKIYDEVYDRIIVIKPIIPVGGKDLGALPGDKFEKMSAWLGPVRDNIEQIIGGTKKGKNVPQRLNFEDLVEQGVIEVEAMTYIQGRSIPRSMIIIDECLTAGHLIYTANGQAVPIENICLDQNLLSLDTAKNIWTTNKTNAILQRQTTETLVLRTCRGEIECTPTHEMWVYSPEGILVKKQSKNLSKEDLIPVATSMPHIVENDLSVAEAKLAALIITDGHIEKNGSTIKIEMSKDTDWLQTLIEECNSIWTGKYSKTNNEVRKTDIHRFYNKSIIEEFAKKHKIPFGKKSTDIIVSPLIWNAPLESLKAYLQILFDAEGDVNTSQSNRNVIISLNSCSKLFIYETQALLLKFGIEGRVYKYKPYNKNSNLQYRLTLINSMCAKFANDIGFTIVRKQDAALSAQLCCNLEHEWSYPLSVAMAVYNALPNGSRWNKDIYSKCDYIKEIGFKPKINNQKTIGQSVYNKIIEISKRLNIDIPTVGPCTRILSITNSYQEKTVYDMTVDQTHTFVVNGVLSSNCQNLTPREARMVIERCGKGSKVVLLGDPSQVENTFLDARSNGLAHAVKGGRFQPQTATVTLTKVERSELASVASIIFKQPEAHR